MACVVYFSVSQLINCWVLYLVSQSLPDQFQISFTDQANLKYNSKLRRKLGLLTGPILTKNSLNQKFGPWKRYC